jgi:hypothetical protein
MRCLRVGNIGGDYICLNLFEGQEKLHKTTSIGVDYYILHVYIILITMFCEHFTVMSILHLSKIVIKR